MPLCRSCLATASSASSRLKRHSPVGSDALVVFPDAGKAILPALTSAYKAHVVTVPYRVTPGGKAGVNYNVFIDTPFTQAGENWGRWILKVLPKGGNVLMLSGPKGNSQGIEENKGLLSASSFDRPRARR